MYLTDTLKSSSEFVWENKWVVLSAAVVSGTVYCGREMVYSVVSRTWKRCSCDCKKSKNDSS